MPDTAEERGIQLDLAALGRPISAEAPCGADLRKDPAPDSPYRRALYARDTSYKLERSLSTLDEKDELGAKSAQDSMQWKQVAELAEELLTTRTKDLRVCAWWIEALTRLHGFAGLREGFKAAQVLVSTFWDNGLHPQPDEDGVVARVAPLANLNGLDRDGILVGAIQDVPLFTTTQGASATTGNYQQALEIEKIQDPLKRAARIDAISGGAATLEALKNAAASVELTELRATFADLSECIDAFQQLTATVDAKTGADAAPPSSRVLAALEAARAAFQALVGGRFPVPGGAGKPQVTAAASAGVAPAGDANLATRDEALASLLRVADFFRRTEPHSPLSYSLEQSVRWARMPLPELLDELIADEGARDSYRKLVGIRRQQEERK